MFGALMFCPVTRKDKADATAHELHLLAIITQLFLHCADVRYMRLMRKFQEQEMIKTERTVELLVKYQMRVSKAETDRLIARAAVLCVSKVCSLLHDCLRFSAGGRC